MEESTGFPLEGSAALKAGGSAPRFRKCCPPHRANQKVYLLQHEPETC